VDCYELEEIIMASVTLKNVFKVFDNKVVAVKDFSMDIEDKEFIILVGPSGCGKSTTLRMIAGLEEISDGEIFIEGRKVNDVAPKDRDIAMVFQNYALYPHMTVYENMAFGLKLRKVPKERIKEKVAEAARILDITYLLDRKPKALSGGQRQRVALGRAIVRDPKVFLMDEPLSNLDAKLRVQMRTEIGKLHKELQTTFIYVTHDQTEAMTMGSRIVVMKDGLMQQIASPQELYEKPCNMFVAGFIGSPQMNFINATVEKNGSEIWLTFDGGKVMLPAGNASRPEVLEHVGKEVVLGIRPENIHDEESYLSIPGSTVEVNVALTELMGAETFLYLNLGKSEITARVNPRSTAKHGDTIKIAFDANKIHLFNKDTEETITN